jgi:protein-glucosylgalactosylhydroxylysine glucosidase
MSRYTPVNPPKAVPNSSRDLPAYVSNGLIGLRVRDLPVIKGQAIVSGLAGMHPVTRVEAAAQAPYPLGADIRLNRIWLTDVLHQAHSPEQSYDFSCGELHSRFCFKADGAEAEVTVLTFCSRSQPTLVLQEVQIEVNQACDLTLRAFIDPSGIHGRWVDRNTGTPGEAEPAVDGSLTWETLGGLSTCGAAYVTELLGASDAEREYEQWGDQSPLVTHYSFRAHAGRRYRLRQIAGLVPSELHHEPGRQATRQVAFGKRLGFETLRSENRAAWSELWKGRINLVGAESCWQELVDAAFFYLNSSAHSSSASSTSIFGLAQWYDYHYYYGHIMWDVETFAIPPLLLFQPHAARTMLDYRSRMLPAARQNARLSGFRGIQFPWESSMTHGEEAAPGPGTASWHEDHVTPDVALAFAQYAHATGDEVFLRQQAWPVLHGAAEWIASRVERTGRGYELRRTMGIAEREQPSDNVACTNMAVKVVLRETLDCAGRLGYRCPPEWTEIMNKLVLAIDNKHGVIQSHDGFDPLQEKGATPEPLAGLFPFGFQVEQHVERATIEYYLKLASEYIGSPMLSSLYGVWAAWIGDRSLSARLLDEGYARFSWGHFSQVLEYRPDKFPDQPPAGPFFANLGGFLMSCLYGLPGLRLGAGEPESWCWRPVILPAGWDAIEVDRIWVRGRPARLIARHGDERARVEMTKQ